MESAVVVNFLSIANERNRKKKEKINVSSIGNAFDFIIVVLFLF